MTRRIRTFAAAAAVVALVHLGTPSPGSAQSAAPGEGSPPDAEPAPQQALGPWGVGFQSAWPAWGLSGTYAVNERVTAQAIVGAFGTLTTFGGRGLYRFTAEPSYSLYGFGTVGMWKYGGIIKENVVGFGGGGGVELDWRRILSPDDGSFPPLFGTIDIGLVVANFEHYNFSGFTIGSGIHYRF